MRKLTANALASLIAIVIPPEEGTYELRGDTLRVSKAQLDVKRLAELIEAFVNMPGAPNEH